MIKKMILSLGILSAMSAGAMAAESKGKCDATGVMHIMECRPTIMQGGKGVHLCRDLRAKKTYADVTGAVAIGGRPGLKATYTVKEILPGARVGGSTRYVDTKTEGKDFELSIPSGTAPAPNGKRFGNLEINGQKQPEVTCSRLR